MTGLRGSRWEAGTAPNGTALADARGDGLYIEMVCQMAWR